jgi:lipopolysaccharide export LptBFGC system permease protein LptF
VCQTRKTPTLDTPNFCRHTPNWLWNRDSQKKFENKFHGKISEFFFMVKFVLANFFTIFFHENAERNVAFGVFYEYKSCFEKSW